MTMKQPVRKFRIKRVPPALSPSTGPVSVKPVPEQMTQQTEPAQASDSQKGQPQNNPQTPPQDATTPKQAQNAPQADTTTPTGSTPIDQNEAIQKEGLTGRQLRMARRIANEHKLSAQSDFDAVRLLRAKGIDPFQRSNHLDWISQEQIKTRPHPPIPHRRSFNYLRSSKQPKKLCFLRF